jgi:hypothetical protein
MQCTPCSSSGQISEGCTEGSEEAIELELIADATECYEAKRWPKGYEPGGKG